MSASTFLSTQIFSYLDYGGRTVCWTLSSDFIKKINPPILLYWNTCPGFAVCQLRCGDLIWWSCFLVQQEQRSSLLQDRRYNGKWHMQLHCFLVDACIQSLLGAISEYSTAIITYWALWLSDWHSSEHKSSVDDYTFPNVSLHQREHANKQIGRCLRGSRASLFAHSQCQDFHNKSPRPTFSGDWESILLCPIIWHPQVFF